ncbi:hypothetical protein [Jiulongibacter sediminis]|jgi:hypothetical protein|uniref:hypothetical protein n=1 Tax=Jiulongibacter sediminis TaxID=1605367 RepID=UPI0026EF448A|nr:hypothetical protein [Jiulongibacter sediminis]
MKKILALIVFSLFVTHSSLASIVIKNGLTHVHGITKGGEDTGKIIVKNESAKSTKILIYKMDLLTQCGQNSSYILHEDFKYSLEDWLSMTIEEKVLDAGEEFTFFYKIQTPENAETGSYWSMIMVEGTDPYTEKQANGVSVNSIVRYGIQVVADIGFKEESNLSVADIQMENSETPSLDVIVQNNGAFSEKVRLYLEVYNEDGEQIATIKGLSRRVYPRMCSDYKLVLESLQKGTYEAVLVMDNGKDLFASNISLEI